MKLHNSKLGEKFHFLILQILTKSSEGFSFRYRRLDMSKKLRLMDGLNLGSIPNDHMPSQKDPKISNERRCSTILPRRQSSWKAGGSCWTGQSTSKSRKNVTGFYRTEKRIKCTTKKQIKIIYEGKNETKI